MSYLLTTCDPRGCGGGPPNGQTHAPSIRVRFDHESLERGIGPGNRTACLKEIQRFREVRAVRERTCRYEVKAPKRGEGVFVPVTHLEECPVQNLWIMGQEAFFAFSISDAAQYNSEELRQRERLHVITSRSGGLAAAGRRTLPQWAS